MLVKNIVYIAAIRTYDITGYCGHTLYVPLHEWPIQDFNSINCEKCEEEYKIVERMLHFMYQKKVKMLEEQDNDNRHGY